MEQNIPYIDLLILPFQNLVLNTNVWGEMNEIFDPVLSEEDFLLISSFELCEVCTAIDLTLSIGIIS